MRPGLFCTASPLVRLSFAAAAWAWAAPLWADANPYTLALSQTLAHDTNLYRTADSPLPDKYAISSVLVGVDQPFGRQRFRASAELRATRFEDVKELNNTGYGVDAALDWATVEQLSGNFKVALNESLARYGTSAEQPQLTKKNIENSAQADARVRLGLVSLLSLDGALSHRRLRYSASEFSASEITQNTVSMGLTVRPSGLLTLGSAVRQTRGEYPGVPLAGGGRASFSRTDLDLTAIWFASGLSTVDSRLSFGRQTSEALTRRNFSGATGSLSWAYLPTGKLAFNTSISRDTGAETSFFSIQGTRLSGTGDNSRFTTAAAIGAAYAASAKIKLNTALRYSRRSLVNEQAITGLVSQSSEGVDAVKSVSLGANYEPTRNWQIGCNALRETRRASGGLSNSYSATSTHCAAQFSLK